jgi:hypothetical protein
MARNFQRPHMELKIGLFRGRVGDAAGCEDKNNSANLQ